MHDTPLPDALMTVAERKRAGHGLRQHTPRASHASWSPPPGRRDPVDVLIDHDRHRVPALLPIRYGRMRKTPFAFLRGAASVMAADLAATPATGLQVQACGDCHILNFGAFASPEGVAQFDITDFDETLPAPFEWDLKRLAASAAVAGRCAGLADKAARALAREAGCAYRQHMAELARADPLDAWRSGIDLAAAVAAIEDPKLREREHRKLRVAAEASHRGYPKLIERTRAGLSIRKKPPLVAGLDHDEDATHAIAARAAFASYRATLPADRRVLLERYRLRDIAFKVVGVGSVGTFCAVGLFATADEHTLLLQIKEAEVSVLAPFGDGPAWTNQGQRVTVGQRLMQTLPDVFLGWTRDDGDDRHCYVRRLKDSRLAAVGADIEETALAFYAALCGRALARAHARSGDAARIAGYLGDGGGFDAAVAEFAMAYADQTDRDWRLFDEAVKAGRIQAVDA